MGKTSLTVCIAAGLALANGAPIHAGVEETPLLASDGENLDKLGASVAIEGDTIRVGAPGDVDLPGGKSGSVYVFVFTDGVWNEVAKLRPEDGEPNDRFGISVAATPAKRPVCPHSRDPVHRFSRCCC